MVHVYRASASGERQMYLINCFCNSSIKVDGFWNPRGRFLVSLTGKSAYFTKISNTTWKLQKTKSFTSLLSSNYWIGGENQLREAPLLRRYQNQVRGNSQLHGVHFSILVCIHNYNTGLLHRCSHLLFRSPLKNNHLFSTCFFARHLELWGRWEVSGNITEARLWTLV